MNITEFFTSSPSSFNSSIAEDNIQLYFETFNTLTQAEKWDDIIKSGLQALEEAELKNKFPEKAKICAHLTSSFFYKGNYREALQYAEICHVSSENFENPSDYIRALYLESACHRALAGTYADELEEQASYQKAVDIAKRAFRLYQNCHLKNDNLKGKIHLNWGAAYADNPKGNLIKAERCYAIALDCFKNVKATIDIVRIQMRLGKIYLLQSDFVASQMMITHVRSQILNSRLTMHADYLEAQLKVAQKEFVQAKEIAHKGLNRALSLGAKADENRFEGLLEQLKKSKNH